MIVTHATIVGVKPDEAKSILEQALSRENVDGYEVQLQSVVSAGATFVIYASPTSKEALARLFGELNLMGCPPVSEAAELFRKDCEARQGWESGGKPGKAGKLT